MCLSSLFFSGAFLASSSHVAVYTSNSTMFIRLQSLRACAEEMMLHHAWQQVCAVKEMLQCWHLFLD